MTVKKDRGCGTSDKIRHLTEVTIPVLHFHQSVIRSGLGGFTELFYVSNTVDVSSKTETNGNIVINLHDNWT